MNFKKITLLGIACLFPVLILLILGSCSFFPFSRGTSAVSTKLLVKGNLSNVEMFVLTVSGPGMRTIEKIFTDVGNVSIEVPAGNSREFEMQVNINPSDPGAVLSYFGSATVNLKAGASVTIPITMELYETKLIIPDMQNDRLVKIDGITGSGWSEIDASTISEVTTFRPYDVDFDNLGRIYIATSAKALGEDKIIRIDDWDGTNETTVALDPAADGIEALSVDRVSKYIYYVVNNDTLHRCGLDGGSDTVLTTAGMSSIRGLTVDENGILFIAYADSLSAYDPVAEISLDTKNIQNFSYGDAWDAMVRSSTVYVATYDSTNPLGIRIVQFTFDGSVLTEQNSYTSLYGPHRFVGVSNSRIYFTDDDFVQDRIVAIDNIAGDNFQEYGTNGTGIGQFDLFE